MYVLRNINSISKGSPYFLSGSRSGWRATSFLLAFEIGVLNRYLNEKSLVKDSSIEELARYVDTLIVIPNQNLFRVANEKTTFAAAFAMADLPRAGGNRLRLAT